MDESRLNRLSSFSHPVTALLVSVPFIWILDAILRATVLRLLFTPLSPIAIAVTIFFQCSAVITTNRVHRDPASAAGRRVREVILLLIASAAAFLFIGGYVQAGVYNPIQFPIIYSVAITFAGWLLTVSLHRKLKTREVFLKILVGKQPGSQLQEAARNASSESGEADEAARKFRSTALGLTVLNVVLFVFAQATSDADFGGLTRLLVAQLVATALAVLSVNGYLWENDALTRGAPGAANALGRRFRAAFVLTGLVVLLSVPFAGEDAIVPPSVIDEFMRRATNQLDRRIEGQIDADALFRERRTIENEAPPGERQTMGGMTENQQRTQEIARITGLSLAGLAGVGLLFFLVRPLFSRDTRDSLRNFSLKRVFQRIGASLQNAWRGLVRGVTELFRSSRRAVQEARKAVQTIRENIREQRRAAARDRGGARQKEVGKLLRSYVRLAKWGEKAGYGYQKWMGPHRYTGKLADLVPAHAERLRSVGETFELLVYGPQGATPDAIDEFGRQVDEIVKGRP